MGMDSITKICKYQFLRFVTMIGESTHIAPGFVNAPMLLSQKL